MQSVLNQQLTVENSASLSTRVTKAFKTRVFQAASDAGVSTSTLTRIAVEKYLEDLLAQ